MLDTTLEANERITTAHRAKLAYVYVRQSTAGQVRQHQESTELQYRLVNRAVSLGWPRDRVEVIDEDLGKSGASSEARHGFQRLIAEIGLANAGLILSLDASRLARNNRDWHQLLELCSLFGVLIADGERLYDPRAYHDRLLLGLSGIMSEAELHQIQVRLHQGERQKAARGELRLPLPAGLARNSAGTVILNLDEEVQARIRLVFAEFRKLQSAKAVTMVLRRADLQVPVRPILGPAPHEVAWREANTAFTTDHFQDAGGNDRMGRSVLAWSSDNARSPFHLLYDFSNVRQGGRFINVSPVIVHNSTLPGLPDAAGDGLLVFGSGLYRASNPYLCYLPLSAVEDQSQRRYFAGRQAGSQKVCWSTQINSKGTAVLNARRARNRGKPKRRPKTTPVLGFSPKHRPRNRPQLASRAPVRAARCPTAVSACVKVFSWHFFDPVIHQPAEARLGRIADIFSLHYDLFLPNRIASLETPPLLPDRRRPPTAARRPEQSRQIQQDYSGFG
jgi:DNA invertase Pin-like site-specific DNA recombinase